MKIKSLLVALIIGALTFSTTAFSVAEVSSFSDVGEWDTTFKAIDYLRNEGVVVGYEDGTYGIDSNINRAEFLKIVMEVTDYELSGEDCFPDVTDQWFAPYVCTANELGFVDGYDDGNFKPENDINFAEASKIVTNILGMELVEDDQEWFSPYVLALEENDSIPAEINGFDHDVLRGEMAEMIWRIDTERTYKVSNTFANIQAGQPAVEEGAELMEFESCVELANYFEDNSYNYYGYWDDGMMLAETDMAAEGEIMKSAAAPAAEESAGDTLNGGGGSDEFSETNVQVEGVDEADIVKTDGEYIYLVKGYDVRVVKAYPPEAMEEVGSVNFGDSAFYPYEMYVDGDRLVVIGTTYTYEFDRGYDSYYGSSATAVYIVDISDKTDLEVLRRVTFEGSYNTSRKINDTVYLVANQYNYYIPWEGDTWVPGDLVPLVEDTAVGGVEELVGCGDVRYMPGTIDVTDYTILAAIPVDDPDADIQEEVVIGAYGTVYASPENMYIAEPRYNYDWWYEESGNSEETYIHKFGLDDVNIDYQGVGTVPGTVLNQFSMDEDGEYFRIATTKGWWDDSSNNVYVLDGELEQVGSLEGLAPGEQIYSTRFIGDRLYMVTFEQIDPLFVIDLSVADAPKVLGELHIPGVSDYLHPLDENHIIGFGLDTASADVIEQLGWSWFQGMKMSMFDVTDVSNPVELYKEVIGDRGTTSELLYNHKALLWDGDKGIMAFPVLLAEIPQAVKDDLDIDNWVYGDYTFQGAYVYDVSVEDGFTLKGTISHYEDSELGSDFDYYYYYGDNKDVERIVYIGDYYYTVSNALVQANEMDSLDETSEVELAD
ncbi:MAG: beta-propeller domain-containing protein [Nitrospirota bacterium]